MMFRENRGDKISRFSAQLTAVGGHFESVADLTAVRAYVSKLASTSEVKQIVCDEVLSSTLFPTGTLGGFIKVASPANSSREDFFRALETAKIGVSSVDVGVAETGTLIIGTSNESNRLVTALPEIHIAILPSSKLVSSLQDAEPRVSEILNRKGGVTVSLISASSRTSDIGDMVILGVHGPKQLHVLLMDQELLGGT